jgi:hypothetical protein
MQTDEKQDVAAERQRFISKYGEDNVWNTQELQDAFTVHNFHAPYVTVTRKSDGIRGILQFQHMPRFYFDFTASR